MDKQIYTYIIVQKHSEFKLYPMYHWFVVTQRWCYLYRTAASLENKPLSLVFFYSRVLGKLNPLLCLCYSDLLGQHYIMSFLMYMVHT